MGLECFEPKGAFYAFPSIKQTGLSSEEFAKRLLWEGKVAVVPAAPSVKTVKVLSGYHTPLPWKIWKKQ